MKSRPGYLSVATHFWGVTDSKDSIVMASKRKVDRIDKSDMVKQGMTENQAYDKVYDDVYKDELGKINEMLVRKQLIEVELFFTTGEVFTIYELETWTDEMKEFYKKKLVMLLSGGLRNKLRQIIVRTWKGKLLKTSLVVVSS